MKTMHHFHLACAQCSKRFGNMLVIFSSDMESAKDEVVYLCSDVCAMNYTNRNHIQVFPK